MAFSIGLNNVDIAFAERLNKLRAEHTTRPRPPGRPLGDFHGCLAEVAGCRAWFFDPEDLGYDHGGTGDGGKDLVLPDGTTLDIKSSVDHPDSWLIKRTNADWYVFALVEPPYQVHFLGKQTGAFVRELPLFPAVKGTRRIELGQLLYLGRWDFMNG